MVRTPTVTKRKTVWTGSLLAALSLSAALSGQARGADAVDAKALESLLARAATSEPGTYLVSESAIAPAKMTVPVIVQADVQRGSTEGSIRLEVALGAEVSRAAQVRLRLVATGGATPRVIADAAGSGGPGGFRLVHEFSATPGEYELQAVVGQPGGDTTVIAALAKSHLTVPDVWHSPLAVTPPVLADAAAPTGAAAEGRPLVFGPTALRPATSARLSQQKALNVAYRVYNWTGKPDEKPDLTVEYVFYQQLTRHLTFFNKIKPQRLTADTLGASFDPTKGVVSTGMAVPLTPFPPGDFQLRVRLTDNRAKRTTEQQLRFTVVP